MDEPRDRVEAFERHVRIQFESLASWAKDEGSLLKSSDIPPRAYEKCGREHEVYHHQAARRFWKSTFPGESGFGPFGYYTPAGYLQRLRLSNHVFGDDVRFEGMWRRRKGWSIVTSQQYIHPHPLRFIPTEKEIKTYLRDLGFRKNDRTRHWQRDDGVELGDTHDRNFIRTPDENIVAIDVQPRLMEGADWENVREFEE
ncbi:MAG: hypothetical protein AAGA58_04460 [Verrucomicrobiota bacterium]